MNPPSPRAIIRPTHHPANPGAHDPGNLLKKKKNKTLSTKVQTELRRKQKKPRKKKKKKEEDREVRQRVERRDRD